MTGVVGVIPARLGSTRLPAKVLRDLCGKPVIQHVYERTKKSRALDEVIVACDHQQIADAVKAFGGKAVLTSEHHATGTDRLAEVVNDMDVHLVINIQGDEPLVNPMMIDDLVNMMQKKPDAVMGTIVKKSTSYEEFQSQHVVKAVLDEDNNVLYFSRSPIPTFLKEGEPFYKHIGIYAYTKEFLFTFKKIPPSYLETNERLEQLRALENGYRICAVETQFETIGIDTEDDLQKAKKVFEKR